MRAPEFAAGWSEAQVAWEPQSLWLVSEEGGVSWKRVPSTCEACTKSKWLVPGLRHTSINKSRSCGPGVGQATARPWTYSGVRGRREGVCCPAQRCSSTKSTLSHDAPRAEWVPGLSLQEKPVCLTLFAQVLNGPKHHPSPWGSRAVNTSAPDLPMDHPWQ